MSKIIFERKKCIGCGICASLCPKYWEMVQADKSHLKDSEVNPKTGNEELEVEEVGCNQEVADSCPVECIYILKENSKIKNQNALNWEAITRRGKAPTGL